MPTEDLVYSTGNLVPQDRTGYRIFNHILLITPNGNTLLNATEFTYHEEQVQTYHKFVMKCRQTLYGQYYTFYIGTEPFGMDNQCYICRLFEEDLNVQSMILYYIQQQTIDDPEDFANSNGFAIQCSLNTKLGNISFTNEGIVPLEDSDTEEEEEQQ